jgi:hypothetical protein
MIVFGAWLGGLAGLALAGRRVRVRGEAGHGPRGRIESASLGGVTATLLRDHPAPVLLSAAAVAYAGLFFLLPLLAGDRLDASLRVMCSAIAAPFFLDAVRRIGWARRAGVRLTATEVIVRDWGQTRRLRWSDLRVVFPARILRYRMVVLVAEPDSAVRVRGRHHLHPRLTKPGFLVFSAQCLPLDADTMARVLVRVSGDPSILGTPAGPDLVRSIADGTA